MPPKKSNCHFCTCLLFTALR